VQRHNEHDIFFQRERIQQIVFLKDKPKLFFTEFRKLFFPQFCDIGISVINMSRCHPVNG
jgi:hypothetical protein